MALPGVRNSAELAAALHYIEATAEEQNFGPLLTHFGRYEEGVCVYCNHCLPCPAFIDVAQINRLLDAAATGLTPALHTTYDALPSKASACTECGVCTQRCPFGVDVVPRMRQTAALFEAA
jgi:predicted aldo/keto reductase-like oxidoreductase